MGIDAEMFVRTMEPRSEDEVKQIAYRLGASFGSDRFWHFKDADYFHRCAEIVSEYGQDGPTLYPEKGEQFIRIHPATRYYGIGYERGDLPFLLALSDWLEASIPGGVVWYGGDSSGVEAKPMREIRAELWRHFCANGHEPYVSAFAGKNAGPYCTFCEHPMTQFGFGAKYEAYSCHGCGDQIKTTDGRKTWTPYMEDAA
jgi:hypothetical protein